MVPENMSDEIDWESLLQHNQLKLIETIQSNSQQHSTVVSEYSSRSSSPDFLFRDDQVQVSAVTEQEPICTEQRDFMQKKLQIQLDSSFLSNSLDMHYFTSLCGEALLQPKQQTELLLQVVQFMQMPTHTWNHKPQEKFSSFVIWDKINFQLLAFSDSFCDMTSHSKEELTTSPFYLKELVIPQLADAYLDFYNHLVESEAFYYQSTHAIYRATHSDVLYTTVRNYLIPNSILCVCIYEQCDYNSDFFIIDGLKFEPTYVVSQEYTLTAEELIQLKLHRLNQALLKYKELTQSNYIK